MLVPPEDPVMQELWTLLTLVESLLSMGLLDHAIVGKR